MTDDPLAQIRELMEQARAEGRILQFGEEQCAFCGAELGEDWETLRIHSRDLTAYIRLCEPCSVKFDIDAGIFQKVYKG